MRPILGSLALALALALAAALAASPACAEQHEDAAPTAAGHHDHAPPRPDVARAQRYAADAPLRRHMAQIRSMVDTLGHAEMGHLDAAHVTELASGIAGGVRDIIAECALPPDADAALHRIIAPLMQQAQALEADPADAAAVARMRAALAEYARLFDDPATATR